MVVPINVNDLLILLNQDYVKGMGVVILLQIIFTGYIIENLTYELIINFQTHPTNCKKIID
ncbi:hypothetical protein P344_01525 [Spiroplasma mirum ATCC 29335]|uniref:Uncharacterized protein n=1 Tax=Spiroplasma mirum ATCC 29335 TaxID=838561 RepID=W0GKC6_9MOLU|nr:MULTISPECIES: hypothetical protein [Spiroplasma]AHF60700.1 hypothetical protein SMM_0249 [Spiroplasma mirum ATCC 29335]AHI57670.1 hypothetical protein P344_01525 [Spiroplasma mirum ATCC 29335]